MSLDSTEEEEENGNRGAPSDIRPLSMAERDKVVAKLAVDGIREMVKGWVEAGNITPADESQAELRLGEIERLLA